MYSYSSSVTNFPDLRRDYSVSWFVCFQNERRLQRVCFKLHYQTQPGTLFESRAVCVCVLSWVEFNTCLTSPHPSLSTARKNAMTACATEYRPCGNQVGITHCVVKLVGHPDHTCGSWQFPLNPIWSNLRSLGIGGGRGIRRLSRLLFGCGVKLQRQV